MPMSFSLNEIEVMGKRAARGVGLSWGLAEEAGKAVRWLAVLGMPSVEKLADILTRHDRYGYTDLALVDEHGVWTAPAGRLCPLIAGAAISDRASEIVDGRVIELGETAEPLLLLPFVAGAAALTGVAISIAWDDLVITFSPKGERFEGNLNVLTASHTAKVHCRLASKTTELAAPAASVSDRTVSAAAWSRLDAFAQRTFAPATEASRQSGAGAGPSDNN